MFYYYGRKGQIVERYPAPTRSTVIEPFAGSAAYASHHIRNLDKIVLVEKNESVVGMWRQLLDPAMSIDDIVPPLAEGEVTGNRFHVHAAVSGGGTTQSLDGQLKATPIMLVNVQRLRHRMHSELPIWRSKDVTVISGDYTQAPDTDATWFIDPPYFGRAGALYRNGSADINYDQLADWCQARLGQTIVCEGPDAEWLPFRLLTSVIGVSGKSSIEMVWEGGEPLDHGQLFR